MDPLLQRRFYGGEGANRVVFTPAQIARLARGWGLDLRRWPTYSAMASAPSATMPILAEATLSKSAASGEAVFTISTAAVDRMGDTIAVNGWKLDAYRRNPVVLWGHDSSRTPIGKGRVWKEGGALVGAVQFAPSIMGQHVADLVAGGFLKATSVGFRPISMVPSHDKDRGYGIDFLEQELLEFSIVAIPANPEATIRAKQSREREVERRERKLALMKMRVSQ